MANAKDAITRIIKGDRYELVYPTGGHGGPYVLKDAMNTALGMLKGDRTMNSLDVVNRRTGMAWTVTYILENDKLDVKQSTHKYRSPYP